MEPARRVRESDDGRCHEVGEDHEHACQIHRDGDHQTERQVEEEIPQSDANPLCVSLVRILGDEHESTAEKEMEETQTGVDQCRSEDVLPAHPENRSCQKLLDLLTTFGSAIGEENRGGRGNNERDADDRLLRHRAPAHPGQGEDGGAESGGAERKSVGGRSSGLVASNNRGNRAESRDLRQCEIDEDHTSQQNVEPHIGVKPDKDQACHERRSHELENVQHLIVPYEAKAVSRLEIHPSTSSKYASEVISSGPRSTITAEQPERSAIVSI